MNDSVNHRLLLNGQFYDSFQLNDLCNSKLKETGIEEWEKDIYSFIQSWIDKTEFVLVNTSGSTGKPKQIRLLKTNMINSALLTGRSIDLKENTNTLLCLPAKYIAGKMMIVRAFVLRLNLIIVEPSINPMKDLDLKINFASMVPLQVSNILKDVKSKKKLSSIDKVLIGGGSIDGLVVQQLRSFSKPIYETYGMTETCTHIALKRISGDKFEDYFRVLDGIDVHLDKRGCITINAPDLYSGEIITNDMGEIIEGNAFKILGRADNIINSGGIKISPEIIEAKIAQIIQNPFIITSAPDNELGEKLVLLIEDKQRNIAGLFDLWQRLEKKLNGIELPRQIEYLASFVYTENGKVDRVSTTQKMLND